jgi:hypothetical protein
MIESRTLYQAGDLSVVVDMHEDSETDPNDQDFENPEQRADFLRRFRGRDFEYIGLEAKVVLDGAVIGRDGCWGIEYGQVAEGVRANPWEHVKPQYPAPNETIPGSPLNNVILVALDEAKNWLTRHGVAIPDELASAMRWADPNKHPE